MSPHLDVAMKETMKHSLDSFFLSLQSGGSALRSFLGTWSSLGDTIISQSHQLQAETLFAAQDMASIIKDVSLSMLELEQSSEKLVSEGPWRTDILKILDQGMGDLTINEKQTPSSASHHPAYIKPSYTWLLSNLHNPYPSKETKKSISCESNCSMKDIDAWFIDTRKRIGWNKLRKTKFANKQDKIIAAATQIFGCKLVSYTDDLSASLISEMDPNDAYRGEFIAMERRARSLYADRFPELELSASFDRPIQQAEPTPSPEDSTQHIDRYSTAHLSRSPQDAASSYPTPEPSPPSYVAEELELSYSLPVPNISQSNSRKRRQSSSNMCEGDNSDTLVRPSKRSRTSQHLVTNAAAVESLPSPANTTDFADDTTEEISLISQLDIAVPSAVSEISTLKRKRRLSDGQSQGPPKRPHNAYCLPRLQTVSDPLPVMKPLLKDPSDEWSQGNSALGHDLTDTIPSPANVEDLTSLEAPLNIDLYQYDFSPYNPEVYLAETLTATDLGNVEPGAPRSPPDISNSSSAFESLFFTNAPQDAGLGFIDTTNVQFDLVPEHSCQLDFQCDNLNTPNDFSIFENPDLLLLAPGYIPDSSSLLGDAYSLNNLDSGPVTYIKTSVLGNFNHTGRQGLTTIEEKEARLARVQALQEELAQLLADGVL